jgi:hypothetical protein
MTRPNGEGCQTKLRYEDYLQHVTQHCCELKVQCNCGKQVRKKEFALHLSEECPNVKVLCKRCNLNMPRKHLHQNLDECLLALMKTNEKILRDLEDIKYKPAPLTSPPCCPKKHQLMRCFAELSSLKDDNYVGVSCKVCMTEMIDNEPFYWNCTIASCSY